MSKHPKVIAMMAMAQTANGARPKKLEDARPDGELTGAEAKSILTDIARAGDPVLKIRAVEALGKIIDQEEQRDRRTYHSKRPLSARTRPPGISERSS